MLYVSYIYQDFNFFREQLRKFPSICSDSLRKIKLRMRKYESETQPKFL